MSLCKTLNFIYRNICVISWLYLLSRKLLNQINSFFEEKRFFSSIFWFLSILCVVTANKRVRNYSLETWVGCEKELPSKAGFSRWSSSLLTSDRNEEPDKSGMLRFWSGSGRALVGRVHGHQARSKGRSDAAGDCRARCWHVSLSHPADCHHQHKKDWNVDQKCVWKSDNINFIYVYLLQTPYSDFKMTQFSQSSRSSR